MHHRKGTPSSDILFCNLVDHHSSVLNDQFPSSIFIPCSSGCGWTTPVLCISHTCTGIFKHINPPTYNSTRHSIVPILSSYLLMNLCTWCTLCPRNVSHIVAPIWWGSQVLLPCPLLRTTLMVTARSTGLSCPLVTTPYNTPTPHSSCPFYFL
jgi:hypothetical protein